MTKTQKSWTEKHPELGTEPIDVSHMLSPDAYECERRNIFGRDWLNICRVEDIPESGDFIVKSIDICSADILVVRGQDQQLRAFYNMCSHRANQVTRACQGHAARFVCPFHHWTYDLEGKLIRVTDEDQFFDLDVSRLGLKPVALEIWQGFVFINLKPEPTQDLRTFLGDMAIRLDAYPFNIMARAAHYEAEVEANWKLSLDSFQEGYHVPFLHWRSAGRAYANADQPFIHALDFTLYDRHRVASFPGATGMQPSPLEQVAFRYGSSVTKVEEQQPANAGIPDGLNPTGSPNWAFDLFVFYPNFMLFAFNGFCFTYNFWPKSLTRTLFEFNIYFPPPQTAGQRFAQEMAVCGLRDTLMEDGPTLEAIQRNLMCGSKRDYVLQDQEVMIRHSHHVLQTIHAESRARK
jgi:Rieske 2Fe-2S family protein